MTFLIGPQQVRYRVHTKRLCAQVPYFDAFIKNFDVSDEQQPSPRTSLHLLDVEPTAFDLLMEFVDSNSTSIPPLHTWDPISFFTLAEKCELPILQNLIIDALIDFHINNDELPSAVFARQACDCTKQDSKISTYALWGVCYALRNEATEEGWPKEQVTKLFQHPSATKDLVEFISVQGSSRPEDVGSSIFSRTSCCCSYTWH